VHWGCDYATAVDVEVDPQRRCFCRPESDFALTTLLHFIVMPYLNTFFFRLAAFYPDRRLRDSVKRDLVQCQKRPSIVSKETTFYPDRRLRGENGTCPSCVAMAFQL
jgi:hypothetical protein